LIWLALISLGFLAGLGAWIYQLSEGLAVTNMRNPMMWGLYITFFMYFVGMSAGGLIVASSGRLFGGARVKPIVRLAVVEATVAVFLAAIFLLPDLGRPDRVWHLFRYPQLNSPLMWDIVIVTAYLIISLLYVWVYTRADHARTGSWLAFGTSESAGATHRDERMKTVLAAVGLPAAILLHSITAWIFGLQISRGFWYTAVMAPLFIGSALVSGTALMILLALVVRRVGRLSFRDDLIAYLGKLLTIFLAVEAFLARRHVDRRLSGSGIRSRPITRRSPPPRMHLFWFEIVAGLLIPFLLLVRPRMRMNMRWVAVASVLAVVGIFAHRFNIVLNGLSHATIPYPPGPSIGVAQPTGTTSFVLVQSYYPSWVEWLIALGVLCLGALIFTAATIKLPLREAHEEH
jgi:molybdopterin-containing oxidoreductase family membrane subunit